MHSYLGKNVQNKIQNPLNRMIADKNQKRSDNWFVLKFNVILAEANMFFKTLKKLYKLALIN